MTTRVLDIRVCSVFLPSLFQPATSLSAEDRLFLSHTSPNTRPSILKAVEVLCQQTGSGGSHKGLLSQADLTAVVTNIHLWSP